MEFILLKTLFVCRPIQRRELWWRDDDAASDTPQLRRLLRLSDSLGIPVLLAVIPTRLDESLPTLVRQYPLARIAQHGYSHKNRSGNERRKQELVDAFPLDDLRAGMKLLRQAFPQQFRPILVPPWNRISPQVLAALPGLGYKAVSAGPDTMRFDPLLSIGVTADPVAWGTGDPLHPNPFRGRFRTNLSIIKARLKGWSPIGFLTHHLAMDEAAWNYSEQLLSSLSNQFADPDVLFRI